MSEENRSGCMWWVGNAVFALGCLLLLSNTVDLMILYAPTSFFGYEGIQGLWGLGVGCAIEGTLLLMKIGMGRPSNTLEWVWDALLMFVPLMISAIAQAIHGFVITGTLTEQPQEIQVLVSWLIPNIPTVLVFLFVVRGLLETMPEEVSNSLRFGKGKKKDF